MTARPAEHRGSRLRLLTALRLALCVAVSTPAAVRGQTTLTGSVHDSLGHPIAGAEVSIEVLGRITHTDDAGHYLLNDLAPGMRLVRVRRVGYSPFGQMTQVVSGSNTLDDIILNRLVVRLDTVVTRDQQLLHEDPLLREMEENRKLGLGHFITRAELAKQEDRTMGAILEQFAAIRIVRGSGGAAWAADGRGPKSLGGGDCPKLEDQSKAPGNYCNYCYTQVYLDNMWLSPVDYPNIYYLLPAQTEAIEYYSGGAQTPQRYATLNSECGVVVFHTRRPP